MLKYKISQLILYVRDLFLHDDSGLGSDSSPHLPQQKHMADVSKAPTQSVTVG